MKLPGSQQVPIVKSGLTTKYALSSNGGISDFNTPLPKNAPANKRINAAASILCPFFIFLSF